MRWKPGSVCQWVKVELWTFFKYQIHLNFSRIAEMILIWWKEELQVCRVFADNWPDVVFNCNNECSQLPGNLFASAIVKHIVWVCETAVQQRKFVEPLLPLLFIRCEYESWEILIMIFFSREHRMPFYLRNYVKPFDFVLLKWMMFFFFHQNSGTLNHSKYQIKYI